MVSTAAQLSLFDTAAVIKPTYKTGDRVKLRKKPIAASYVKKGDIVEIAAVHPIDGSIKFWNERSERWEFVQGDEIGCVVPDDSPTPAEIAVIESTLAPAENDLIALNPISTYKAGGTARSGEYFRLSYRIGERVRHCHIRGGNTDSPIAQAKVQEVRSLLAAGIAPAKIAIMLKSSAQLLGFENSPNPGDR